MSEQPAESPRDGDTAKRHGDALAEVVETDAPAAAERGDADGEQ